MSLGALHTLVSAVLVVLILIGMMAILVGIRRIITPSQDSPDADTQQLRRDVEQRDEVISTESLFRQFLARDTRRRSIKGNITPSPIRQQREKNK